MSQFRVIYTVPSNAQTVKDKLRLYGGSSVSPAAPEMTQRVASYTDAIAGGMYTGTLLVATSAVAATGTVTLASSISGDTVTINGVVFTEVASGATNNQFNHGATDTITAANLASAINISTTANVNRVVSATSAAAIVTITSKVPGNIGNLGTLAISAHGSVSGATLTGGSEDVNILLTNS